MSGSCMGSNLEKCDFFLEKQPFFQADMARLGIYHIGGFGRIGVYRVKDRDDSPSVIVVILFVILSISQARNI